MVKAEPVETLENRLDSFLGRAFAAGILDAQEELATRVASEQPVE